MLRVKVLVDGRAIGWLRTTQGVDGVESLVSASCAKSYKFDESSATDREFLTRCLSQFVGPDRATAKSREPVVSFQLVRI